jgi:hypothetical protein
MTRNPIARHAWKFNKKRVIENKKLRVKRVNTSMLKKEYGVSTR